ncbi:peptidylprolyl isomerase [Massiliimalia massiliensis]|uniref:peptidylprolyl isomerase n=1 Tax=Massiliimalia massiliensis TaxID=1852384 RepID=UPI000987A54B|nr:peptidylprolyl isomerase [Massiliimalia massiliensis]
MNFLKKAGSIAIAAALTSAILMGCGASDLDATVMTIDGEEISNAEYRYYFNTLKSNFDQGDENYWEENEDQIASLKTLASQYLLNSYAVSLLAEEEGVALTEDEKKTVDDTIQSMIEQYGSEEKMEEALDQSNLTSDVYRKLMENNLLSEKLFEQLYGDQILENVNDENYFCAKHILVKFDDEDAKTHKEELEAAQKLLKRAQDGEDFDTLIEEYGEDPGMTSTPQGYYFDINGQTPDGGGLVEEFYKATQALEINGISDIVETSYGYHIIKRMPLDMDYIAENKTSFANDEINEDFSSKLAAVQEKLDVEYKGTYKKISTDTYTKS